MSSSKKRIQSANHKKSNLASKRLQKIQLLCRKRSKSSLTSNSKESKIFSDKSSNQERVKSVFSRNGRRKFAHARSGFLNRRDFSKEEVNSRTTRSLFKLVRISRKNEKCEYNARGDSKSCATRQQTSDHSNLLIKTR